MAGKHFDLDTSTSLGGENASDITIASQKATKAYIDTEVGKKQNTLTAGTGISISGNTISATTVTSLSELTDTTISSLSDGQMLKYNASESKWENKTVSIPTTTNAVTSNSTAALTSGGAYTNLVTNVVADSTSANKIKVTKAGSTTTITVNNVANATTASKIGSSNIGGATTPVYIEEGTPKAMNYTIQKSVPSDAVFTDTKNTAGATDTNNKIFLVGTTSQSTNAQTYSHDTAFVDANGMLNSSTPSASDSSTKVATTKWVSDKGYLTEHQDLSEYAKLTDIPTVPTNVSAFTNDAGYLSEADIATVFVYKGTKATVDALPTTGNKQGDVWTVSADGSEYVWDGSAWQYLGQALDLSGYQEKLTAVTHSSNTAVGGTTRPVYIASNGAATTLPYTIAKSVPSDAKFTDTTYSAGTGISLSGTTINHSNSVTAGTAGTSTASSGSTLQVPYITYDAQGHITAKGNRTHTVTGFLTQHQSLSEYAKLTDLPTVPTNVSAFNNDAGYLTQHQSLAGYAKTSELATVATSGKYSDLSGKPTIPTVPESVSAFNNDAGYITNTALSTYVQNTRKVNNKALSSDITLTYSDVNALSASTSIPTVTDTYSSTSGNAMSGKAVYNAVKDKANSSDLANYVPTTRTINSKALSENISLTYSDVGALSASTSIPTVTDTYSSTSSNAMSGKAVYNAVKNKADKATSLSGYGITDAYTKTEVDNKLTSAMVYKGTKASESALPTTGNKVGDVWNVTDTGHNYAWDGTAWDKLSGTVDLSGYVPTTRKVAGKALTGDVTLSASDVGALPSNTSIPTITDTYSSSSSNGMSGKAVYSAINGISGFVPTTRKVNNKALSADISLTYSDVGALSASTSIPTVTDTYSSTSGNAMSGKAVYNAVKDKADSSALANYVPTTRTIAGKALSENITLSASDVGALPDSTTIPTVTDTYTSTSSNAMSGKAVYSAVNGKQDSNTAVKHTASTAVGSTVKPVYVASNGTATTISYSIAKSVPSDAIFTDTTYTAGAGLSLSGTEIAHSNSITAGTAGTSTATSGSTLAVPYVTYDAQGHITAKGTHTHTVTGFATSSHTHTKSQITDFPTIPTVTDTYSSTSSNAMSGKAVYSAISGISIPTITDTYSSTSSNGMSGKAVYSALSGLSIPSQASDIGAAASSHTHSKSQITDFPSIPTVTDTYSSTSSNAMSGKAVYSAVSGYVPTGRKVAGKALTGDITLSASDVGALPSGTSIPTITDTYSSTSSNGMSGKAVYSAISGLSIPTVTDTYTSTSSNAMSGKAVYSAVSGKQDSSTAVTHTASTAVGSTIKPVYIASNGAATTISYTIAKSVPSDALFTDTVYTHPTTSGNKHIPTGGTTGQILKYSADGTATWANEYSYTHPTTSGNKHIPSGGTTGQFLKWSADGTATWAADNNTTYTAGAGLSLNGTEFKHSNSVTAGTAGTSTATSGSTLAVPYVTYDAQGHITAKGTHTHTVTGFATTDHTHSGYQSTSTAVSHTASTAVGNTITPVYVASDGKATTISYTIAKSVPSDAKFSDTVYTHPTTSGNKHIPSGGTTNQYLKWSADGTATWAAVTVSGITVGMIP